MSTRHCLKITMTAGIATAIFGLLMLGTPTSSMAGGKPGDFDYYVLALSWSPTYCAGAGRNRGERQCAPGRAYAFVLHGLWPQYKKGWPEHCRTKKKPWVPKQLINKMLDIMPSPKLVIHEYKKHGTCSGFDPEGYYRISRQLFDQVTIPARYLRPSKPISIAPHEIEADFLKTNLSMDKSMIAVACGRSRRLREVRICFSKDLKLTSCGVNERQSKLCKQKRIIMPPVRSR